MKWLPIKGYEELYEVSNHGTVRSVDRVLQVTGQKDRLFKGQLLTIHLNSSVDYPQVKLYKENKGTWFYVHRLVATAFLPNPLNKPEVNHINGDRTNNDIANLEWSTSSENSYHAVSTGLRTYTSRLTEEEFLECLHAVIEGESYLSLSKRVPYKVPYLSTKLRKLAKKYNIEHLLDNSLYEQKVRRAQINGNPNLRNT